MLLFVSLSLGDIPEHKEHSMLPMPYDEVFKEILKRIPKDRVYTDSLRTMAYGTDASFYRLIPKIVVDTKNEEEVVHVLKATRRHKVAVTFRAAGTSLSGQAISDSVLVRLGEGWRDYEILDKAKDRTGTGNHRQSRPTRFLRHTARNRPGSSQYRHM